MKDTSTSTHTLETPPIETSVTLEAGLVSSIEKANTGQSHRIAGDIVNRATADLPDNQRSTIRRLHAYYIDEGLSLNEVADRLDISPATVGLIFKGKYDAGLGNMIKKIDGFFDLLDRRSKGRRLDFMHTSISERIWSICEKSLEMQRVSFIFGDGQVGKSASLESYQKAHNHGSTIYVNMPVGGNIANFLMTLARPLRISDTLSTTRLRERIKSAIDDRMLLIIDEAHRCIRTNSDNQRQVEAIEYARQIFDEKKCGLVICATNIFRDSMENGPMHRVLRQIKRRRLCTYNVPNQPPQSDLDRFAEKYNLAPSTGDARKLEREMIQDEALGMWLTLLQLGAILAKERKQKMTWSHVIESRAALKSLESPA